jgi:hypothetical protein
MAIINGSFPVYDEQLAIVDHQSSAANQQRVTEALQEKLHAVNYNFF